MLIMVYFNQLKLNLSKIQFDEVFCRFHFNYWYYNCFNKNFLNKISPPTLTPTQNTIVSFSTYGFHEIRPSLVSLEMIFEALQSEKFRFHNKGRNPEIPRKQTINATNLGNIRRYDLPSL